MGIYLSRFIHYWNAAPSAPAVPASPPRSTLSLFFETVDPVIRLLDSRDKRWGKSHCIRVIKTPITSTACLSVDRLEEAEGTSSLFNGLFSSTPPAEPNPETTQNNKRTWQLFKAAVIEQTGRNEFEAMCQQYSSYLPIKSLEKGDPLLIQHIKVFYTALAQLRSDHIQQMCPHIGSLSRIPSAQITEIVAQRYYALTGTQLPPESCRPIALPNPSVTKGVLGATSLYHADRTLLERLMKTQMELKRFDLPDSEFLPNRFSPWLEFLAKDLVNRELRAHQLLPAPLEDGSTGWYEVYARVAIAGLMAYALKPLGKDTSLKPLILFRPTQRDLGAEGAIATFENDTQLKIGRSGWEAAQSAFTELLADKQFRKPGERVGAVGFSLGGAHCQHFLAEHHADVAYIYTFNAPSIDDETVQEFAQKINDSPTSINPPLQVCILRSTKDKVPSFGHKHIGHGIEPDKGIRVELVEVEFENDHLSAIQQHTLPALSGTLASKKLLYVDSKELNNKLDNTQRGPEVEWYQKLHHEWGWIVFRLIQVINRLIDFIRIWVLGISRRSSALQYQWHF